MALPTASALYSTVLCLQLLCLVVLFRRRQVARLRCLLYLLICLYNNDACLSCVCLITLASSIAAGVGMVFSCICDFVCLSVCVSKWLELSSPKLVEIQFVAGLVYALNLRSKGQDDVWNYGWVVCMLIGRHIFRPHLYAWHKMWSVSVCLFLCVSLHLSLGHNYEPCKNS